MEKWLKRELRGVKRVKMGQFMKYTSVNIKELPIVVTKYKKPKLLVMEID